MMKKHDEQSSDPLIADVRANRRALLREHGGLAGWVAHLRREQEKDPEKLVPSKTGTVRH